MRTKSIILGAALLAAGAFSAMAQSNVYSLNVVGYVNVTLAGNNAFTFFANPLDFDGTGTNNTVQGVFSTNLPSGSVVYKFSAGGWNTALTYASRGGWNGNNASLNPGEGAFVFLPTGSAATTITTAGTVLQGSLTNSHIATGFTALGSIAPVSGAIDSTGNGGVQYTPTPGDIVYSWNTNTQQYVAYTFASRGGWNGNDPVISVGEGFFISTTNSSPSWVQNFTVQ